MGKEIISDELVLKQLEQYRFPGMGVGVIKDGKVLLCKGYGYRDLESRLPITENTQWGIASCSKAFTATLAGILSDEGVIDLDRPIKGYLPDFRMYDSFASAQCTLRDMLCHRTGLGGYDALWCDEGLTREDLWKRLRYLKPNMPFRSVPQYSNLIYAMAGHVMEKVTGRTWDDLIKEKLFEPIGMTNSNTSVDDMLKSPDFATPYWQSEKGPVRIKNWNVDLGGPAASVNSTLSDMLKWLQFNIDGGVTKDGRRLLSEETHRLIHTPQVPYRIWPWDFPEVPPVGQYAMGWYDDVYRGYPLYFHIGEIEGYGTMQWVLPGQKLGIVVFNNIHKPCVLIETAVAWSIIDSVLGLPAVNWADRLYEQRNNYGNLLEHWALDLTSGDSAEEAPLSHKQEDYAGIYENPGHGPIRISFGKDGWICEYRGVNQKMEHCFYDTFRVPDVKMDTLLVTAPLTFIAGDDGQIDRFEFRLYPQVDPIIFKKNKV